MGIADIQAAINSIPAKKEDLRKAFEDLESYSSSFASFTLQWRDIDDHFSSIGKSIDKSFQELKAKLTSEKPTAPVSAANAKVGQDRPVIEPRQELKYHCVKMDATGLKSYILGHRKDTEAVRRELGPALLCSPDPATLVLDSFEGFVSSSGKTENEKDVIRRAYLTLLECFHALKLEVKHSDKERARRVAKDCYDLIKNWKNHHNCEIINYKERNRQRIVLMVFLHLIVAYGLLEYFAIGDILDVLVTVASKKNIVDLCRYSALEEKLPDLIDKLNKKGRQLDSVKFVLAFNLQHKFPPASLFEAYIKEAGKGLKKRALEGKSSTQLKIVAVRAVIKAVEEYNLGYLYPPGSLQNRIQQLKNQRTENKKQRLEKKQVSVLPEGQKQQKQQNQHQQPKKRPRPSDSSSTVLRPHSQIQPQPGPVNSAPTGRPRRPHSGNLPQLGLVDQAPYMGLGISYGSTAAPPLYGLGNPIGLGGSLAPPESSYLYPPAPRPLPYGGYPGAGFPPYNHSLYP